MEPSILFSVESFFAGILRGRSGMFPAALCLQGLLLIAITCSPALAVPYRIEAGEHDSKPGGVELFSGEKMSISFAFDDSAKYLFSGEAATDQGDINKLYGLSDCFSPHMSDSARFGWRWYADRLEIHAFTHKNGEFSNQFIDVIQPNRPYKGSIELSEDRTRYIYTLNGIRVEMERGCRDNLMHGYHLRPYFGGNRTAPHAITVRADSALEYAPLLLSRAFPNPAREPVFRTIAKALDDVTLSMQVFDITGQLVHEGERVSLRSQEERTIETRLPSWLASGVYIIRANVYEESGKTQLVLMQDEKFDYIKWVLAK